MDDNLKKTSEFLEAISYSTY